MTRSPFGRLVLGSRRGTFQGGYVYALWVAGLASGLLIADQVIWTVLQEEITARPAGRVATLFWTGQVLALCLVVALCGIGFRPRIDVAVDGPYLRVASNKRTLDVPLSEIRSVIRVPADEYHRTYRRSSAVRHFVNRLHSEVVVFETPDHTVALGLSDADTDLIVGVLSA